MTRFPQVILSDNNPACLHLLVQKGFKLPVTSWPSNASGSAEILFRARASLCQSVQVCAGGGDRAALYGPAGVLQGSASKVEFVAVLNDRHRVSPSVSTGHSL